MIMYDSYSRAQSKLHTMIMEAISVINILVVVRKYRVKAAHSFKCFSGNQPCGSVHKHKRINIFQLVKIAI